MNEPIKEKKRTKLISKITVAVLIIIAFAVLISTIATYYIVNRSTSITLGNSMSVTAGVTSAAVSQSLSSYLNIAQEVANNPLVYQPIASAGAEEGGTGVKVSERNAFLKQKGAEYSLSSIEILTTTEAAVSAFPSVANALSGEKMFGSPFINSEGVLVIDFSVPIWNNGATGTQVIGVLACTASQEVVSRMLDGVVVGKNGYSYIIDKNGVFIACPDKTQVENKTSFEELAKTDKVYKDIASVHTTARTGAVGYQEIVDDSSTACIAYNPIAGTDGWSLIMGAKKMDFLSTAKQLLFYVICIQLAYLVFVYFLSHKLLRLFTDPISIIKNRLCEFATGDVSGPIPELDLSTIELYELQEATRMCITNTATIIRDIDTALGKMAKCDFNIDIEDHSLYVKDYASIEQAFLNIRDELSSLMAKEAEENNAIIDDLDQVLEQLSHGNLDYELERPELFANGRGKIKKALYETRERISKVLSQIHNASEQVFSGSVQVSDSAQSMAQGATEQASTIEELTSELCEIDEHIKSTAEETGKARALTESVSDIMMNSLQDMNATREAMDEIASTSKDISKVIKVIDDIAFQTNILALNAAVEAARAGAVGRGFAVVADEVRNLSQKSAEAAKSTTTLIESSIAAVEKGSSLVNGTHEAFEDVVAKVGEVVQAVENVSDKAAEQAESIGQVYNGVKQVSEVVQLNSATSEESAAASEELSSQALVLKNLAAQFTLYTGNKAPEEAEEQK